MFRKTNSNVVLLAVIALVASLALLYVVFAAQGTSAAGKTVPEKAVGNLKVEFLPFAVAPGLETVTVVYNGAGEIDISDWQLSNETGLVTSIPAATVLTDGDEIMLCAEENAAPDCVGAWTGDVWSDVAGELYFSAPDAVGNFIAFSYENNENSVILVPQRELVYPVYESRDQVPLCHKFRNERYRMQKDKVDNIVEGTKGHVAHEEDVIEFFYYNIGNGVEYYAGNGVVVDGVSPSTGC